MAVLGIEINEKAANSARKSSGLSILSTSIEISIYLNQASMWRHWDVLEHLPSPKSALQKFINY
jgi:hypothetical protein